MKNYMPTEASPPPGTILKEELEARGWSQADLAAILGRPPRLVNEIIKAKRAITPETAHALGEALKTGPELWMNLESLYQLSLIQAKPSTVARRAQIFGRFPVRELQKRGWISGSNTLGILEQNLLKFFGLETLESDFAIAHAAKRTNYEKLTALQAAWLSRARQLAPQVKVDARYSTQGLRKLYQSLRGCMWRIEDVSRIPAVLSGSGIRLIVIEQLPGSKIDGACFWLTPEQPVIALSLRYDRHDMFCHALFHELDHIEHEEGRIIGIVDTDLMSSESAQSQDPTESRANNNAGERLISAQSLKSFVAAANNSYSESKISSFADAMEIHPGVVVGRLQHEELLPWSSYNHLKAKVRHVLTDFALTDGFGNVIR